MLTGPVKRNVVSGTASSTAYFMCSAASAWIRTAGRFVPQRHDPSR